MSEHLIDLVVYQGLKDAMGEDFMDEIMQAFFEEGSQFLADLRSTLESGDLEGFRRAAHSLKSTSATFGAMELTGLAKELEELARENYLIEAAGKLEPVSVAFYNAKKALEELKNG